MWVVKKSKVHGHGVFATNDIKNDVKIIEYVGEKVSRSEGDKRSEKRLKKYLNSKTTGSVYIFELNSRYDIDGSPHYNKARYINHSCRPNCEVDIRKGKIWIKSIKKIKKGEELTYDYGYEFDPDDFMDHKCRCGEKNCVGYIVSSDDRRKLRQKLKKIQSK
ncbi:MAG: SET domain-containing protein-lysine N-methyltransferase [Rhodobiaceae bacterium]|nr:SET domain-containing protein-lysine N-methyltransferase [Rhodobiaceae bacterium]|tara:strand:- start:2739 stop:3224 length:486 start_codon:yes stop_codon:yes gene_type:complete